ncbi:acyl-CoA thioesterase [Arenibacter sp. GZD96]|uniref:acyl-CoA thioesterase n=1 Tax=Aurantibrevibacter litoralis TaxID=3106030 RepID=UPI002AFEAA94|nr:acyl-CoA thioesterase [Arenibacter sp. GZD-96]MEA1785619.1 acyl-CoA thioesterase [Arenibacter sp. GZD-96]
MFLKEFEIRWSDLDANRHLANASYLNFMAHTRMDFLHSLGMNLQILADMQISPVVFHEHIYYFKEAFPGKPLTVSLEILGLSADGMFFEFLHNFYDSNGRNLAHCEMMGAWINTNTRTLSPLPEPLLTKFQSQEKATSFKVLTKADTRKFFKRPIDLV